LFLSRTLWGGVPMTLVFVISVITGLVMLVIFRYTSNQQAVKLAKERLQAQLLAVRLFQDQLPVVLRSYGRILRGTFRYLRVAGGPFLLAIVPMTLLIIQLDHWFGMEPFHPEQTFLVKAQFAPNAPLDEATLHLPDGLTADAPAVHIARESQVVWRVAPAKYGAYQLNLDVSGQTFSKTVVVGSNMPRLSWLRTQSFWEGLLSSAEPRFPKGSPVESIAVIYPARDIAFLGWQWNWIILFFILSMIAGFAFKSILGVEI
jgi:hypothetical protein